MDASDGLDRELIVERAEELRSWLADLPLSAPIAPLERELEAIIANDPGAYIDGKRPLTGLTVDAFVAELHASGSGAVTRVRGIGQGDLDELRAAIEMAATAEPLPGPSPSTPAARAATQARAAVSDDDQPVAPKRRGRPPRAATIAATPAEEAPTPRRRGRPPRAAAAPLETPATANNGSIEKPAPRRRGRPPRAITLNALPLDQTAPANDVDRAAGTIAAPTMAAEPPSDQDGNEGLSSATAKPPSGQAADTGPALAAALLAPALAARAPLQSAPFEHEDHALQQLLQIWPGLHPHARRAVLLYVSALLVEGPYEG